MFNSIENLYEVIYSQFAEEKNVTKYNEIYDVKKMYSSIIKEYNEWHFDHKIIDEIMELRNILEEGGYIFLFVPKSVLITQEWKLYRETIIEYYNLRSIVLLDRKMLTQSITPMSMIVLRNVECKSLFTSIRTIEEFKDILDVICKDKFSSLIDENRIFYPDIVDSMFLNPEYYDPKYEKIESRLRGLNTKKLNEIAEIFVGSSIPSHYYTNQGWKYIRPRNIKNGSVNEQCIFVSEELAYQNATKTLIAGDILIPKIFNFSEVAIVSDEILPALASSNLFVIRCTEVPTQYLYEYLLSDIGKETFLPQLEHSVRGTTIPYITKKAIGGIQIPILAKDTMLKIAYSQKLSTGMLVELTEEIQHTLSEIGLRDIVINMLLKNGWTEESMEFEHKVKANHLNLRVDVLLKVNKEPIAIVEIKKKIIKFNNILYQINIYLNALNLNFAFLMDSNKIYLYNKLDNKIDELQEMIPPDELVRKMIIRGVDL